MAKKRLPPLVKGLPLLGSLFDMRRNGLGFMTRDLPKYDDNVRIRVGPMEAYVASHPEDVEYVLRGNHRNFIKNKGTRNVVAEVLGQGLVTSEGELWRRQRRLAEPAFQHDQIDKYSTVMVEFTNTMLDGWHPGEMRNIHSDMMRLTLEVGERNRDESETGTHESVRAKQGRM
jgi:cytochrome P450